MKIAEIYVGQKERLAIIGIITVANFRQHCP